MQAQNDLSEPNVMKPTLYVMPMFFGLPHIENGQDIHLIGRGPPFHEGRVARRMKPLNQSLIDQVLQGRMYLVI